MYCVNCGVKLADTEKQCPLCGVRVYHPDIKQPEAAPLYPKERYPEEKSRFWLKHIITAAAYLLLLSTVMVIDLQFSGRVTWSGYVVGGLILSYILIVLPAWFQKPHPIIFVPCDFAAAAVYLLYIDLYTGGGWFLSFAFPVVGGMALIATAVTVLLCYLKKAGFFIIGGASLLFGGLMLLTEYLMQETFVMVHFIGWSYYPVLVFGLLGLTLIVLGIFRPAREALERKFFI